MVEDPAPAPEFAMQVGSIVGSQIPDWASKLPAAMKNIVAPITMAAFQFQRILIPLHGAVPLAVAFSATAQKTISDLLPSRLLHYWTCVFSDLGSLTLFASRKINPGSV
jgi:hypothetical protein